MKYFSLSASGSIKCAIALFVFAIACNAAKAQATGNGTAADPSKYHTSTVGFYENKGQIADQNHKPNPAVKYLLSSHGFDVQLRQTGFSYDTYTDVADESMDATTQIPNSKFQIPKKFTRQYHRVDIELPGCNPNAIITAEGKSDAYYNYLTTGTQEGGVSNVHYYDKVIYKNIYPNIDLEFFTNTKSGTGVEYNFVVHKGGNPADIKLAYKGANKITLTDNKLVVNVASGDFTENIPSSYIKDNPSANIKVSYAALGNDVFSFSLPDGLGALNSDLVIDPTPNLGWGTFYGGTGADIGQGIAVDASENVYMTGYTASASSIATSGVYQTTYGSGGDDAFLAKFNSSGAILWATYYGGSAVDIGYSVATDASGNIYMTGYTQSSSGIATSGTYQPALAGSSDGFLAKFNSSGAIQWATYFGGSNVDVGESVATDASGNVYMGGYTTSASGIATSGVYQAALSGSFDGFLSKFNSSGVIQWATYYGGGGIEVGTGVATDVSGNVYLAGWTTSASGIATSLAYQTTYGGGNADGFLSKFNTSGTIQWATYYGGSANDTICSVATDPSGDVYFTGETASPSGIATSGAYQAALVSTNDAFLSKFNSSGAIQWGTYYGGSSGGDRGTSVATDALGNVYMGGSTASASGIATTGAFRTTLAGSYDAFLAKFNNSAARQWGTYYGGTGGDYGQGVATACFRKRIYEWFYRKYIRHCYYRGLSNY